MKIVSVINYKGGVGKTTVTSNLGARLAQLGKKVLLIDLDPQTNLTFSFVKPDFWEEDLAPSKTIRFWFEDSPRRASRFSDLIHQIDGSNYNKNLDLISSDLGLINIDLELAANLGGANIRQAASKFMQVHTRLRDGLKHIESFGYDYVLIDCPPNFNIITKNALVACSYVMIPAKPDYLSTQGIDYLIRSILELIKNYNEFSDADSVAGYGQIHPLLLGVVFTMVQYYNDQPIAGQRQYISRLTSNAQSKNPKGLYDDQIPLFNAMIRNNQSLFAGAAEYQYPVAVQYSANVSHDRVISEFHDFVNEFIVKCI
jgi:chromosome partitioning protein